MRWVLVGLGLAAVFGSAAWADQSGELPMIWCASDVPGEVQLRIQNAEASCPHQGSVYSAVMCLDTAARIQWEAASLPDLDAFDLAHAARLKIAASFDDKQIAFQQLTEQLQQVKNALHQTIADRREQAAVATEQAQAQAEAQAQARAEQAEEAQEQQAAREEAQRRAIARAACLAAMSLGRPSVQTVQTCTPILYGN